METSERGATCLSARRGHFLRAERTRHLAAASVVAAASAKVDVAVGVVLLGLGKIG